MSRRVNFSPQQRVDQPDAQAISELLTQDIRRVLRAVVMGRDAESGTGRVLAGFGIEAENPGVSPRIIVRLNLGGGSLGAFMGAINQGVPGAVDWGQLGGDRDGVNNLEGSAQNLLDFTGQPPGVYQVKLRAVFLPGIVDNRAFWNSAGNTEFIKATPTRLLPQWEVAFQGHADPEWVLLGEVDWDGVSVAADDITDQRAFPIEGQPRPAATLAEQWTHASQNDADAFGVGDFTRSDDRSVEGAKGIWEGLRYLARQVQDIKGGRESDLRFDWASRVYAPAGFLAADPTDKTTKTLRSVDAVTFTCADGTTEQGDFNGANAINDCFVFIAANAASLPRRIEIVVKSRTNALGSLFTWDAAVTITDKHIKLRAAHGSGFFNAGPSGEGQHWMAIDASASPAVGTLLSIAGYGVLDVEGIAFYAPPAGVNWISVAQTSSLRMQSCTGSTVSGDWSDDPAHGHLISAPSSGLQLRSCVFSGSVFIGGKPNIYPLESVERSLLNKGVVENCSFNAPLRLRRTRTPSGAASINDFARGLVFDRCFFYGFSPTPIANGNVDVSGASDISWRDCEFFCSGDSTMIHGMSYEIVVAAYWSRIERLLFDHCTFAWAGDATHEGTLTGAGGVEGAVGTGWGIHLRSRPIGSDPVSYRQLIRDVEVRSCSFRHSKDVLGGLIDSSADAGCMSFTDTADTRVKDCHLHELRQPGAGLATSDIWSAIRFSSTVGGSVVGAGVHNRIDGTTIDRWLTTAFDGAVARLIAIDLNLQFGFQIDGTTVDARVDSGIASVVVKPPNLPSALYIRDSLAPNVRGCDFLNWYHTDDLTNFNVCIGLAGAINGGTFHGNKVDNFGGNGIIAEAASDVLFCNFSENTFAPPIADTFSSCIDVGTLVNLSFGHHFIGNRWSQNIGDPIRDFIRAQFQALGVFGFVCMANGALNGNVVIVGHGAPGAPLANFRGYAEAGQDLNLGVIYA